MKEQEDKRWKTTGLKIADKEKLLDDLWNLLHNRQKVNVNLLTENDVEAYDVGGDLIIVIYVPMEDLNYETVHAYRNSHRALRPGHPFERLDDQEYLRSIGAAAISNSDDKLHPTTAGMLMFGDEYNIVRQFPEYFLDYREMLDPATRWTDRLQ